MSNDNDTTPDREHPDGSDGEDTVNDTEEAGPEEDASDTGQDDTGNPSGTDTEPGTDDPDTDTADAGTDGTGSNGGVMERVHSIPAEDWLLIALAALVVVPFGYTFASSQGLIGDTLPADVDPEVVEYCEDVAEGVEEDAEFGEETQCDCIPPGQFDEERYQTAEDEVRAVTELFLVECSFPHGQDMTFPIGYIPEDVEANMTEDMANQTVDDDIDIIE